MNAEYIIIDDDEKFANQLKSFLEFNQLKANIFNSAEEYLLTKSFDFNKPRTYLIDLNLPGLKGSDLLKVLRYKDKFSIIFMLSGDNSSESLTNCLRAGADDYINKPFDPDHLLLKIQNANSKLNQFLQTSFAFGIKLVPEAQMLCRDGIKVHLTQKEFEVASYLLGDQGMTYSRTDIILSLGGPEVTDRTVDVHVCSLRKKIKSLNLKILTIRGKGYQIAVA